MQVVIRGAGDLATGIGWRLHKCGFQVIMLDLPRPTCIRRTVAFSTVLEQAPGTEFTVEGVQAVHCETPEQAIEAVKEKKVAVLADPEMKSLEHLGLHVLVDAILAKKNLGTNMNLAPVVIGVGPGFTADKDCHFVVETNRGHYLGRVIEEGSAAANTGVPGNIQGYTSERILRSPAAGVFEPLAEIGQLVKEGQVVGRVDGVPMYSQLDGMVRGMLAEGIQVTPGFKCGDVDPRGEKADYTTISDKARAIAGGVLEAILRRYGAFLG